MTIESIIDFLKNDIRGLILLAVVTSLLAAFLYDGLKKGYLKYISYRQNKKTKKLISTLIRNYSDGYTAGYAHKSSYHQTVLTGHYLIKIILHACTIIFLTIVFVASLILIGQPFSWIITIVFSFVLTIQYRRLKELREMYVLYMDQIFGEEFKEKVKKHSIEHVESKLKDKK